LLLTGLYVKPIPPTNYFITNEEELIVIYKNWLSRSAWERRRQ